MCGCHSLNVTFICRCCDVTFIYLRAIKTSKVYPISDKKSNQWSSICCIIEIIGILVIVIISNV